MVDAAGIVHTPDARASSIVRQCAERGFGVSAHECMNSRVEPFQTDACVCDLRPAQDDPAPEASHLQALDQSSNERIGPDVDADRHVDVACRVALALLKDALGKILG